MASIPKLVLLLLCAYHTLVAHAGDGLRSYKVLPVGSLKSAAVNCSEHKVTPSSGGVTVPLHHRHGPCSPSPVPSTKAPTLEEMLRRDQLRAAYITRKYSGAKGGAGDVGQSDVTVPTTLGSSLGTLEYVITVGIGSPAVTQTMLIDTGSDVSWVQCKPCSRCHSQADSLFDPSSSSTYSPFSCSSAACAQLRQSQEGNGCSGSKCQYISIPTVSLVFSGGAVVNLASDGIILGSCLAFAANNDDSSLGIIGNVQQRTFEVLYDVGGGAVGFKAGAC